MNRAAFLTGLLAKPYQPGAAGPEAFDCYGLVRHVGAELFGHRLPERDANTKTMDGAVAQRFRRVPNDKPEDGAIVLMRSAGARHVGIYLLPEGGVFHAVEPPNWQPGDPRPAVRLERLFMLPFGGFSNVRLYVPK